jgi:type II secretory pathway pseudopilin PulG
MEAMMPGKQFQRGFSLVTILLALAIIGVLYVAVMKNYLKNPARADRETQKALAEQGVDTAHISGITQKAQDAADKANAIIKQQQQNVQDPQ